MNIQRGSKGNILTENVVLLVLNLVFLSILFGFLFLHSGGKSIVEKNTAKQIALLIDSSEPYTEIALDLSAAAKNKDKNFPWERVVQISGNTVIVKLSEKSQSTYTFFNAALASANPRPQEEMTYIIRIEEKT
jgi:hypothetical protein